jgi:hypothetical protein
MQDDLILCDDYLQAYEVKSVELLLSLVEECAKETACIILSAPYAMRSDGNLSYANMLNLINQFIMQYKSKDLVVILVDIEQEDNIADTRKYLMRYTTALTSPM